MYIKYLGRKICIDVAIKPWRNAEQNSWTLGTCKGNQTYSNYVTNTKSCCLVPGHHELTCDDSVGDGWDGGFMTIEGKVYCKDFRTGHQQRHKIDILGNCLVSK